MQIKSLLHHARTLILSCFFIAIVSPVIQAENLSGWELHKEHYGIQIYTKTIECNRVEDGIFQEYILLKFVNTTNQKMRIEWDMELWYDDKCYTCDVSSGEYHYTISLNPGASTEGQCDLNSRTELNIFKRFLNYDDKAELTKFNFANLEVNPE